MTSRTRELLHYIVPSAGSLCVTYLYNIVDGIFIGHGVGSLALGAVNITVPFITIMIALSSLFAMGGSTVIAIRLGRGDDDGANNAFMTSLVLLLVISVVLTVVGTVFTKQIVILSGSSEAMLPMAMEYLFYYTLFFIPFLCSNCLSVFVRNDGAPNLAFWGMTSGALANIFLDWLFIFPFKMGLKGAAIASGLGQLLSLCVMSVHFIRRDGKLRIKRFSWSWSLARKVCKRGLPEFFSQFSTPITIFCYNWVLVRSLGDIGVSTFSVLSFLYSLSNALISGVALGLQPLWGNSFGKKDGEGMKRELQSGLMINLCLALVIELLLTIFNRQAITIFNRNPELVAMASSALPFFASSFLFMAANLIFTAYFYSTKQTGKANLIAICRGFVIKVPALFIIPSLLGSRSIWYAATVAEALTTAIALVCRMKEKRETAKM